MGRGDEEVRGLGCSSGVPSIDDVQCIPATLAISVYVPVVSFRIKSKKGSTVVSDRRQLKF